MDQYRGSSRDLQGRSHLYSWGAWAVQVGLVLDLLDGVDGGKISFIYKKFYKVLSS